MEDWAEMNIEKFVEDKQLSNLLEKSLSNRELETLEAIAQGFDVSEIAKKLKISRNTVKVYMGNLSYKIAVPTTKTNFRVWKIYLRIGVFILITVATPYVLGALSNVFFYEKDGVLASVAAGHNVDSVIPLLIKQAMPGWFSYFFMLVILSAAVSTLSSQFHAIGVAFGRDVLEAAARGRLSRRSSVLISRIGIVAAVLLTVFLSMKMGAGIIARATSIFFGIMASGWLAPFLLSLYWQRLTKAGAIAGMVSGLTAALIGFLLFHESESAVFGCSSAFIYFSLQ